MPDSTNARLQSDNSKASSKSQTAQMLDNNNDILQFISPLRMKPVHAINVVLTEIQLNEFAVIFVINDITVVVQDSEVQTSSAESLTDNFNVSSVV